MNSRFNKLSTLGKAFLEELSVRKDFPAYEVTEEASPMLRFPCPEPKLGAVLVCDDVDELTITFGDFTHIHVANYDEGIADAERTKRTVAKAIEKLDGFFSGELEAGVSKRLRFGYFGKRRESNYEVFVWPKKAEK